ncbi:hypothetical protein L2746_19815, partial [Shewanella psychromarinicola]|nr:hypothetical protein [Shewanella psychromarinicola]
MAHENTIPLISKTAFSCPHCGAYTTQHWYKMNAAPYDEDNRTPMIPDESLAEKFRNEVSGQLSGGARYHQAFRSACQGNKSLKSANLSRCGSSV